MSVTPIRPGDAADAGHDTPALGIPRPEELVEWWLRLLGEVARAPFTVYRARKLVDALTDLPLRIEALTEALDRTTGMLEVSLGGMEDRLGELQATFAGVDSRIENLEATVGELTGNITNLIGAIPGARRTLRSGTR